MAHTETFDPKRYAPFEKGMSSNAFLSTFPSIPTVVDGIRFSEGLEKMATVMDRGTLIRSYTAGDLGFILHSRHQYQWHTGYAPPQTVAAPHIGAVVARTLGPLNPAVPAFINIGQRFDLGEGEELKAFTTAGFLGSEFGPFNLPYPEDAVHITELLIQSMSRRGLEGERVETQNIGKQSSTALCLEAQHFNQTASE